MKRRTLLSLGVLGATVLAVTGGALALIQPARRNETFSEPAKLMLAAVARAVLADLMPTEGDAGAKAMQELQQRLQTTISGMPAAMQAEVDELLTIVSSAPGRRALVGLSEPWETAPTSEVAAALQDMRNSSLALRQQAFHALRDLTNAAYFADPGAWAAIGYPGPRELNAGATA